MEAILALEDGTVFRGAAAGAEGEARGEVVFNTSMTGYQEVLTDPSYAGQIVTMTCPEIGNYGVSPEDVESRAPQVAGFIIRDESPVASNWRAEGTLRDYLVANKHRRHLRHRHARADAAAAVGRRDARRHRDRRRSSTPTRSSSARGAIPQMEGSDLVRGVTSARRSTGREEDPDEFGVAPDALREAAAEDRRLRLRDEVEHPAAAERARLRRARLSGDDAGVRAARDQARRRVPEQRPRRSGAADLRDRQREDARRVRTCRCSASASATRFSAWRWAATRSS